MLRRRGYSRSRDRSSPMDRSPRSRTPKCRPIKRDINHSAREDRALVCMHRERKRDRRRSSCSDSCRCACVYSCTHVLLRHTTVQRKIALRCLQLTGDIPYRENYVSCHFYGERSCFHTQRVSNARIFFFLITSKLLELFNLAKGMMCHK